MSSQPRRRWAALRAWNAGRAWPLRLQSLLLLAVATHLLAVWAVPRLIMHRVLTQVVPMQAAQPGLPPMTDHLQRRIVMPSPDLLYATCSYDLAQGPLHISANPLAAGFKGYWSVALYAANSDNFFVHNDRAAAGQPLDLVLLAPQADGRNTALPAGATVLTAPSARGLLLMRVLVADYAREQAVVEAARRTLRCAPL